MLSYELPFILAVLVPVIKSSSLKLGMIAQGLRYFFDQLRVKRVLDIGPRQGKSYDTVRERDAKRFAHACVTRRGTDCNNMCCNSSARPVPTR